MTFENWLMLLFACMVMSFSPGPNAILTLTTTIRTGSQAGMRIVLGSILGFTCLILFAMFGLATVFKHLPYLIFIIKVLGAIYLLYLAFLQLKNSKPLQLNTNDHINQTHLKSKGFYLAISNPKIILFWIAFVPTIIHAPSLSITTLLVVVITFIVVEAIAETMMVVLGKGIQPFLSKHLLKIEKLGACIFILFSGLIIQSLYQ